MEISRAVIKAEGRKVKRPNQGQQRGLENLLAAWAENGSVVGVLAFSDD